MPRLIFTISFSVFSSKSLLHSQEAGYKLVHVYMHGHVVAVREMVGLLNFLVHVMQSSRNVLQPHKKGPWAMHFTLGSNRGWADIQGSNTMLYKVH